jgi:hypothetical protein
MFGSPDLPDPPPPEPAPDTTAADKAADEERKKGARRKGRGANELTSPLGAAGYADLGEGSNQTARQKTLGGS